MPLLQLTALTKLAVLGGGAAATAAAVGVVAQLTGLKDLTMEYLPPLNDPVLLQLTVLAALEDLVLRMDPVGFEPSTEFTKLVLWNKVRWALFPNCWLVEPAHHRLSQCVVGDGT
jgi:hypothetical protein